MERTKTGCLIGEVKNFKDSRGYFSELWTSDLLDIKFKQDNYSVSKQNVVRGMHFQTHNPQGKFVRVLQGFVVDCVINVDKGSEEYGRMESFELDNTKWLYIPPKFAHGFWAIEETIFLYKCTSRYDAKSDGGLNPLDRKFAFPWFSKFDDLIISPKDMSLPSFEEFDEKFSGL